MTRELIVVADHPIQASETSRYVRTGVPMTCGLLVIAVLVGGLAFWGVASRLDSAVVATGRVTVAGKRKTVQHQFGGTIADIRVADGDNVTEGQVLMRLDRTVEAATATVLRDQLIDLQLREARMTAELLDRKTIRLPKELQREIASPKLQELAGLQRSLFISRREARDGDRALIKKRMRRLRRQVEGLSNQRKSNDRQISFINEELKGVRFLSKKGLVARRRLLALEREAERIRGLSASLTARMAQAENAIDELRLEQAQRKRRLHQDLRTELGVVQPRILALQEQLLAAERKLAATEIRSPARGRIVALQATTIGGVVKPGETIMEIVPAAAPLILRAEVGIDDVDRVNVGMTARVRLTAFDATSTPEAAAQVLSISADSLTDRASRRNYYEVKLALASDQPAAVRSLRLIPGMPAEVFIQTGERSPISYLVKPLTDRLAHALRE